MGYFDSIYTVLQVAQASVPTVLEALTGAHTIERGDRRLRTFAQRVIDRAEIDVDVVGAENVPDDGAFVFMSNHQSHFDIPVLYYSLPIRTLRMVGKAELFRIPIWGQAMRSAGMIEVDRSNRERAIASLESAKDAIASGISIWIAPEGSRGQSQEITSLKKGGFHLAKDTGTPIVPVVLSGTRGILPPGSLRVNRGVSVRVDIGAPIRTDIGEPTPTTVDGLAETVRQFFLEKLVVRSANSSG